jgi:hypothetical protein
MARIVQPKNKLKEKLGEGGFRKENIERAQKNLEEYDVDFFPIAEKYLLEIREVLANKDADNYNPIMDSLVQLRAQGSFFQFKSITAVTDVVVDLIDSLNKIDDTILQIINAYEQSMRIILKMDIKDDQNETCKALLMEMGLVCEKYKKRHDIS